MNLSNTSIYHVEINRTVFRSGKFRFSNDLTLSQIENAVTHLFTTEDLDFEDTIKDYEDDVEVSNLEKCTDQEFINFWNKHEIDSDKVICMNKETGEFYLTDLTYLQEESKESV